MTFTKKGQTVKRTSNNKQRNDMSKFKNLKIGNLSN